MGLLAKTWFVLRRDVVPFLCGDVVSLLVCVSLTAVVSFFLSFSPVVSAGIVRFFSIFTSLVCAFVSGFVTVRFKEKSGLVYGGLAGALLFLSVSFIGSLLAQTAVLGFVLLRFISFVVLGSIGGILSVNKYH